MSQQISHTSGCIECATWLNKNVYYYSIDNFGAPLCLTHQHWFRTVDTTAKTKTLYLALRQFGIPARLEKFDGYKTIDIAIPECKVNIEVDGLQHSFDPDQALSDLQRTYYSFLKGYLTLRIPNSLIDWSLQETVEYIVRFLNANNEKKWNRKW